MFILVLITFIILCWLGARSYKKKMKVLTKVLKERKIKKF